VYPSSFYTGSNIDTRGPQFFSSYSRLLPVAVETAHQQQLGNHTGAEEINESTMTFKMASRAE